MKSRPFTIAVTVAKTVVLQTVVLLAVVLQTKARVESQALFCSSCSCIKVGLLTIVVVN